VILRARRLRRALLGLVVASAALAGGCGIPTGGTPTAIAKSDVPSHLINPVTPTTVNSPVPAGAAVPEPIYLVGPSQHVIAVSRDVQFPASLSEIMGSLLAGPTTAESRFGLQSFLTGTKTQVVVTVVAGIATVNFTTNPVQVVGPDQTLAIAQVVYTATQQSGVTGVVFQIASQPIEVPTASGVQVPGPVDRTSYVPQAPLP
jgi:spore germination protein GerM